MREREPDGGLAEWIDILERGGDESDAELLCLLLELRRFREDNPALIDRLAMVQEELKRRDAQEPVAYRWEGRESGRICYDGIKPLGVSSQPLFAAPTAVLPRDPVTQAVSDAVAERMQFKMQTDAERQQDIAQAIENIREAERTAAARCGGAK